MGIIRYADDFIITANSREYILEARQIVEKWLKDRNLRLSEEKTKIVQVEDGFDFLGFNLRTYKGTAIIKPSKAKVLSFCKEIGKTIKTLQGATQETVITKLNPILRGFANYYRGVCSKDTYNYIEHRVWQYLWLWANCRHPNKSTNWVKEKYFHPNKNRKWVFACKGKDRTGADKQVELFYMPSVPIERHVKVKGNSSPDDSSLKEYWESRQKKAGKSHWAKGSKYYQVAQNQQWCCPICGEPILSEGNQEIETHHITPVSSGGGNDIHNLTHVHKSCHKQVHSKTKLKARSKA